MPPPSFLPLHKTNFYLFYHHQLRFPHKWKIKLLSQNKTLGRRTKKQLGEEHVGNIKLIMRFAMQALTVYIVIFLIFWKTKEVYYEKTKCYQFGWTVFAEDQETPRRPVVQSKKRLTNKNAYLFLHLCKSSHTHLWMINVNLLCCVILFRVWKLRLSWHFDKYICFSIFHGQKIDFFPSQKEAYITGSNRKNKNFAERRVITDLHSRLG